MDLMAMYQSMGIVAKCVAVVLIIMSMWSIGVGIERFFTYQQARNQSQALRAAGGQAHQGRPPEGRRGPVHVEELPLQPPREGRARRPAGISVPEGKRRRPPARRPARHRPPVDSARVGADRVGPQEGRLGARDHRLDRAVRRTARHGRRRHQRVPGHRRQSGSAGLGAVSIGISEALVETALGLVVAIPAVWIYNYLTSRIEYFNVEMDNSSSELVDYFVKNA